MDLSFLGKIASAFIPGAAPLVAAAGAVINGVAGAVNPQQQQASDATAVATSGLPIQKQSALPESIQRAMGQVSACTCGTSSSNAAPAKSGAARLSAIAPVVGNPTNASTQIKDGQAVFENDNYIITAGDKNTVSIYNKKTKEVYESVGSVDMKIDGQAGFASKGNLSLMLNDGTKVTLGKADDGNGGSSAAKLTITNGSYGAQIKGIDSKNAGALAVQEFAEQGQALDEQVEDGVEIEENQDIHIANGRGFVAKDNNGAATIISNEYLAKVNKTSAPAEKSDQFDLPANDETNVADVPRSDTAQMQKEMAAHQASLSRESTRQRAVARTRSASHPGINSNANLIQNRGCFGNLQQPRAIKKPDQKPRVPNTLPAPVMNEFLNRDIQNLPGNRFKNIAHAINPALSNRFAVHA